MKSAFLDRLVQKIDKLDRASLEELLVRLVSDNEFKEQILRSLKEGILVCDPDGKLLFCNRAARNYLGIAENFQGNLKKYLLDLNVSLDWEPAEGNEQYRNFQELEVFSPQHRYLHVNIVRQDTGPELRHLILILNDVTDQRQQEKNERQSAHLDLLTMLAAGVAHEIRNPLGAIGHAVQLLSEYDTLPPAEKDS